MATYAVMNGNSVSTVIVADNKEQCEAALGVVLIEYTPQNPAGIGWVYDESTDTFISPTYPTGLDNNNFGATGATGNTGATGPTE